MALLRRVSRGASALLAAALLAVGSGCTPFHQGPLPGEPRGARFVAAGGARVHVVDEGEGPPVVLLHGFASSVGVWAPVLSIGHDVFSPENVLADRYDMQPGTVYLIRPDQHVAARWRRFDRSKARAALARCLGH